MDTVICIPAVRPGDLIDLDFLAQTVYYHPDMSNYLVVYDPKIFTAVEGGAINPTPSSGPEAFINFKRSVSDYPAQGADGCYALLVGNNPKTQHYVMLEGYDGDIWSLTPSSNGTLVRNAPIVKVGFYVAIQDTRVSGGAANESPAVMFKTKKVFSIDNQLTGVDATGNSVYVIDASVTTTLQEAEQLRLDQLGQQITFNDKDGILRVEVGVVQSTNKNIVMPLLSYKDYCFRFYSSNDTIGWSEDRTIRIPFVDEEVKLHTVHKSKVINQGELLPNHYYLFSSKQWPDVTASPDIDDDVKFSIGQLAPVRITAYDGAGAKTIVNLTFKDKMTGK